MTWCQASTIALRRAGRAGGFLAVTAAMGSAYLAQRALTPAAARAQIRDRWLRRWSEALLELFAVQVALRGLPAPAGGAPGAGRLVIANHRSTIDIAILLRTFGGRMVSRADLATWPVLGAAARAVGTIFVDRASATSGATTIRAVRDALRAGDTVCLFAEGTTFDGDEVRPFHAGAFVAALRTGASIVPVGIAYPRGAGVAFVNEPFLAHLSRMAGGEPTCAFACVGEPFAVSAGARAAELRDRAQSEVQRLVREARAACEAESG
jgi:1-acyl-sn-glycerol-3-phosphate acyltransferase